MKSAVYLFVIMLLIPLGMMAKKPLLESITCATSDERTEFEYNAFGSITKETKYGWNHDGSKIIVISTNEFEYDDDNNLLSQESAGYNPRFDKFGKDNRTEYTYDANGRELTRTHFKGNDEGDFEPSYEYEIVVIDANNEIDYSYKYENGVKKFRSKTVLSKSGSEYTYIRYSSTDGTDKWDLSRKTVVEKTSTTEHEVIYAVLDATLGTWKEEKRIDKTYNSKHQLTDSLMSEYDTSLSIFVPEEKRVLNYNSFGQCTDDIQYLNVGTYPTEDWAETYENYWHYNADGLIMLAEYYANIWGPRSLEDKVVYERDAEGQMLTKIIYGSTMNDFRFRPIEKHVYTYKKLMEDDARSAGEEPGTIATKTVWNEVEGVWVEGIPGIYNYKSDGTSTITPASNATKHVLKMYPNPAIDVFTIEQTSNGNLGDIIIYNSLGTIVSQTNVSASSTTIDVSKLKSGTYLIKAAGEVMRFVKQ